MKSKDLAILLSVSLTATAAGMRSAQPLVFSSSPWSLYVIGACLLLWVIFIPAVIYTRMPIYVSLFFDGLAAGLYEYLISFNTADNGWFFPACPAPHGAGDRGSDFVRLPDPQGFLRLSDDRSLLFCGGGDPLRGNRAFHPELFISPAGPLLGGPGSGHLRSDRHRPADDSLPFPTAHAVRRRLHF